MKRFEVRTYCTAEIEEVWQVEAENEEDARAVVLGDKDSEGHKLEHIEDCTVGGESDREVREVVEL